MSCLWVASRRVASFVTMTATPGPALVVASDSHSSRQPVRTILATFLRRFSFPPTESPVRPLMGSQFTEIINHVVGEGTQLKNQIRVLAGWLAGTRTQNPRRRGRGGKRRKEEEFAGTQDQSFHFVVSAWFATEPTSHPWLACLWHLCLPSSVFLPAIKSGPPQPPRSRIRGRRRSRTGRRVQRQRPRGDQRKESNYKLCCCCWYSFFFHINHHHHRRLLLVLGSSTSPCAPEHKSECFWVSFPLSLCWCQMNSFQSVQFTAHT